MSVRVVATDGQTGEVVEHTIPDGDYLLICVRPSHLTHTQAHANGTHVLTVKGNTRRQPISASAFEVAGNTRRADGL